jgi:hypothetical protein
VTCVEHGRWTGTSDAFHVSPHTAVTLARQYNRISVRASLRSTGDRVGNQAGVWSHIEGLHRAVATSSPTGAMRHAFEGRATWLGEIIEGIPDPAEDQTGRPEEQHRRSRGADVLPSPGRVH